MNIFKYKRLNILYKDGNVLRGQCKCGLYMFTYRAKPKPVCICGATYNKR